MNILRSQYGEIHCLMCGRYLADIEADANGRMKLGRARNGENPARSVWVKAGRLHCARCGGRAFVEWDLMPSGAAAEFKQAA